MDHRDNALTFWEQQSAEINGILRNGGMTFEAAETQEILSYLPILSIAIN
jgi:hypothetical protein